MKRALIKNRIYVFIAALVLFAAACLPFWSYAAPVFADETSAALAVHFLDVKQGDCILIQLPDGKNMIIDAGSGTRESSTVTQSVLNYIDKTLGSGFKYFDYAILTHTDSDHCNALDNVLNKYPSYVCYRPNVVSNYKGYSDPGKASLSSDAKSKESAAYKNAVASMYKKINGENNTVLVVDPSDDSQTIKGGAGEDSYSLTFFSPLSSVYSDSNEYSPIMLLEYRGFKFALSGDAEKENEREFVNKVEAAKTDGKTDKYDMFTDDFCVDVFKAGHHGSATSSTQAYLDIVTTEDGAKDVYYVFSCNAEGNKYYHPRQSVLNRISNMGATNDKIMRTDHHGTITFKVESGADGYALSCSTAVSYTGDNTVGADTLAGTVGSDVPVDNDDVLSTEKPTEPSFWEKLTKTQKILVIVAVVVVVIIILVFLYIHYRNGGASAGNSGKSGSGSSKSGSGSGKSSTGSSKSGSGGKKSSGKGGRKR